MIIVNFKGVWKLSQSIKALGVTITELDAKKLITKYNLELLDTNQVGMTYYGIPSDERY